MDLPGGLRPGQPGGEDVFYDLHKERDLGVTAPLQVFRGAHEHGHVPDPGPLAPVQDGLDVLGSVLVPQAGTGQSQLPCPAAVAVYDQPDVPGQRDTGQLPAQLAGVQAISKIAQRHASNLRPANRARGLSRVTPGRLPGVGQWDAVKHCPYVRDARVPYPTLRAAPGLNRPRPPRSAAWTSGPSVPGATMTTRAKRSPVSSPHRPCSPPPAR